MVQQQARAYLQPAAAKDPAALTAQDAQKEVASSLVTYEQGGADAPAVNRILAESWRHGTSSFVWHRRRALSLWKKIGLVLLLDHPAD